MTIDIIKFYFLLMMNKILIVNASDSNCKLKSGMLKRAGYEAVVTV